MRLAPARRSCFTTLAPSGGYFLAVVREIAGQLEDATRMDPRVPVEINLRLLVDSFIAFVRDNPAVYQLLRGTYGGDAGVRDIARETRLLEVERMLELLAVAEPSLQLRTALHGWVGFVEATTLTWVEHRGFAETELIEMAMQAAAPILAMAKESAREGAQEAV